MTLYIASGAPFHQDINSQKSEPDYQEKIFQGAEGVPIYGWVAIPDNPHGTIIGTYGITGTLENQWYLRRLGQKAFEQGFAVVLFDWRCHGRTLELSPTTTSDGLYEGYDFIHIAAQAKMMGCPAPMWLTGYSLGGQLALWGVKAAQSLEGWSMNMGLETSDIMGAAVICPNLESNRSLSYLQTGLIGRYLEKAIVKSLRDLARKMCEYHPNEFDAETISKIENIESIRNFDHEFVIRRLGFASVEEYYQATSPLYILPHLKKPTLIIYAEDDPLFTPDLVPELKVLCDQNPVIDLWLTNYGGHVGYLSDQTSQHHWQDQDAWWALNRILDWCHGHLQQAAAAS